MPDTWIAPRVWVTSERVGQSKMNEIGNDLRVLYPYTTAGDFAIRSASGNYLERISTADLSALLTPAGVLHTFGYASNQDGQTIATTSYTDITSLSCNLTLTKTCTVIAIAFGNSETSNGVYKPSIAINIDGTVDPLAHVSQKSTGYPGQAWTTLYYRTGITAGTRNVKLQGRIENAADALIFRSGKMLALAFQQ